MIKSHSARQRAALSQMPGDHLVRVYTLQDTEHLERALARGYLGMSANDVLAAHPGEDGAVYREAYAFMHEAMTRRIPGHSGDYPVWAWLKKHNERQLPRFSVPTTLVVADVPRQRMLLSDFMGWGSVINGYGCFETEDDDEEYQRNHPGRRGPEADAAIRATWERIFTITEPTCKRVRAYQGMRDTVQACIDRIAVSEIVRMKPVTGRRTSKRA